MVGTGDSNASSDSAFGTWVYNAHSEAVSSHPELMWQAQDWCVTVTTIQESGGFQSSASTHGRNWRWSPTKLGFWAPPAEDQGELGSSDGRLRPRVRQQISHGNSFVVEGGRVGDRVLVQFQGRISTWGFPSMGVPLNHPFSIRIVPYKLL